MATSVPNTLSSIRTKVRRITGRPSTTQMTDVEIDNYINTFYLYDMPEHLKMESLRYNYQFVTTANVPVYNMPTDIYLTSMPPVYIGGYQSYMTQSRENFFRVNPSLNFLQQEIATGDGGADYTGTLTQTPIMPGFKPNPPGAYVAATANNDIAARYLNWNVLITAEGTADATSGIAPWYSLIDDGLGNLFAPTQTTVRSVSRCGTINYITGAVSITNFLDANGVAVNIPTGNPINAQYIPYGASRPQSVVFFQDQFILYPVPDQAYTVSFECYKLPAAFLNDTSGTTTPQVQEWWQLLAYGAADKILTDFGDLETAAKYRPLLDEQMNLVQRRTIVQQTSERSATIYTEQAGPPQYPFGNLFSGF